MREKKSEGEMAGERKGDRAGKRKRVPEREKMARLANTRENGRRRGRWELGERETRKEREEDEGARWQPICGQFKKFFKISIWPFQGLKISKLSLF